MDSEFELAFFLRTCCCLILLRSLFFSCVSVSMMTVKSDVLVRLGRMEFYLELEGVEVEVGRGFGGYELVFLHGEWFF